MVPHTICLVVQTQRGGQLLCWNEIIGSLNRCHCEGADILTVVLVYYLFHFGRQCSSGCRLLFLCIQSAPTRVVISGPIVACCWLLCQKGCLLFHSKETRACYRIRQLVHANSINKQWWIQFREAPLLVTLLGGVYAIKMICHERQLVKDFESNLLAKHCAQWCILSVLFT